MPIISSPAALAAQNRIVVSAHARRLARELEEAGGALTLDRVSIRAGLDLDVILAELEAPGLVRLEVDDQAPAEWTRRRTLGALLRGPTASSVRRRTTAKLTERAHTANLVVRSQTV